MFKYIRSILLIPLILSEFGVPAMPDIRTVNHWLDGNVGDRYAQSKSMMQHNKAGSHERRFAVLMNENFRLTSDLERFVFVKIFFKSEEADRPIQPCLSDPDSAI